MLPFWVVIGYTMVYIQLMTSTVRRELGATQGCLTYSGAEHGKRATIHVPTYGQIQEGKLLDFGDEPFSDNTMDRPIMLDYRA